MRTNKWYQLTLLAVAMVASMSVWFSVAALLPQLEDRLSLTTASTSVLIIAVQVGFVFGAVGSAVLCLADRVNPRRLVLLGSLGAALTNASLLITHDIVLAVSSRFFVGVFMALVYPPALKAMSAWFVTGRGLAMGVLVGALTLGSSSPHLIRSFGVPSWQTVIVVTSALCIGGGLIAELLVDDGPHKFPAAMFKPSQIVTAFSERRMALTTVGYLGHMWELYALWAWIGVFATDVFVDSPVAAARMAFGVVGVGFFGCIVGGILSDRLSRTTAAGVSLLISGAAAMVTGFLVDLPVLAVSMALIWGFWTIADSGQFSAIATEVTDQRYVGTALTVQIALGYLLTTVTIFLVPYVRDVSSWGWAFMVLVPGPIIGLIAMTKLNRIQQAELSSTSAV